MLWLPPAACHLDEGVKETINHPVANFGVCVCVCARGKGWGGLKGH